MIKNLIRSLLIYSPIFDVSPFNKVKVLYYAKKYHLPSDIVIQHGCLLTALHENPDAFLKIGHFVHFANDTVIDFSGGLIIGDYVTVSSNAKIYTHYHSIHRKDVLWREQPTVFSSLSIGNDCIISANAIITESVTYIGDGVIIGAGAVVTKNVEPYSIMGGVPAKVIGKRA